MLNNYQATIESLKQDNKYFLKNLISFEANGLMIHLWRYQMYVGEPLNRYYLFSITNLYFNILFISFCHYAGYKRLTTDYLYSNIYKNVLFNLNNFISIENLNSKKGKAHTKTKKSTNYSTRKLWKQKGTGHARIGSHKSPLLRGGGVVFGPTNKKNFYQKYNKKVKKCLIEKILLLRYNSFVVLPINKIKALIYFGNVKINHFLTLLNVAQTDKILFLVQDKNSRVDDEKLFSKLKKKLSNIDNITLVDIKSVKVRDLILNNKIFIFDIYFLDLLAHASGVKNSIDTNQKFIYTFKSN